MIILKAEVPYHIYIYIYIYIYTYILLTLYLCTLYVYNSRAAHGCMAVTKSSVRVKMHEAFNSF